ncbi:hypothetical protein I9W82_002316 [Candida metapsilosis]|uniref:Uncharacterized protein n=1 Tax=Candida metapsilosis TaxID=273372 RepID=A0A8H7ZIU1_9ASCO|nr:hypothetical protein I9W82_002316 [Candida metapsilosis]
MGLVSIWATEGADTETSSGVKSGASKSEKQHTLESKWSKPITSTSKIESKWASSGSESKRDAYSPSKKNRRDKSSSNDSIEKTHFNKTDGHKAQGNKHHRDKEFRRRNPKDRGSRPARGEQDAYEEPESSHVDDSDEETVVSDKLFPKGPLTESARSLASRITLASKGGEAETDDATVWEEVDDDDEEEEEEMKQKMPSRGKSLAERLDNSRIKDAKQKSIGGSKSKTLDRRGMKKELHRQFKDHSSRSTKSHTTNPSDDQATKEKEEKEKQELLKMIEEFESQKIDWASFDE